AKSRRPGRGQYRESSDTPLNSFGVFLTFVRGCNPRPTFPSRCPQGGGPCFRGTHHEGSLFGSGGTPDRFRGAGSAGGVWGVVVRAGAAVLPGAAGEGRGQGGRAPPVPARVES